MMKLHFSIVPLLIFLFAYNSSFAQKHKQEKSSKYDIQGPYCNGLARVKSNNKWGFIDTTGSVIIPLKYNQVENFEDGLARVRLGQKWGLMDVTGREVIKPTFDFIDKFIDGKAKVLLDGETYYMNTSGQRVAK